MLYKAKRTSIILGSMLTLLHLQLQGSSSKRFSQAFSPSLTANSDQAIHQAGEFSTMTNSQMCASWCPKFSAS